MRSTTTGKPHQPEVHERPTDFPSLALRVGVGFLAVRHTALAGSRLAIVVFFRDWRGVPRSADWANWRAISERRLP